MRTEHTFEPFGTDDVCPGCGEEITVASAVAGQVELECPCACSLAVA